MAAEVLFTLNIHLKKRYEEMAIVNSEIPKLEIKLIDTSSHTDEYGRILNLIQNRKKQVIILEDEILRLKQACCVFEKK